MKMANAVYRLMIESSITGDGYIGCFFESRSKKECVDYAEMYCWEDDDGNPLALVRQEGLDEK